MLHSRQTHIHSPHFQREKYTYEVSLEHQLMKLWMLNNVSESYQALVLRYMDTLSGEQMETELKKQIKKTYERQSFDFKIRAFLKERDQSLQILHNKLTLIEKEGTINHKELDLRQICELLNHIRKIGVIITQQVQSMFRYLRYQPEKEQPAIASYYWKMFKVFGQDIIFLQQSVLVDYIPFSQHYDPLLIEPIRTIKKLYDAKAIYYNNEIEELFTVNVSYLYRLMRANQMMLKYANLAYSTQDITPLSISRKQEGFPFKQQQGNTLRGQMSTLRTQGSDYIPYRNKTHKTSDNNESNSPSKQIQRSKAHSCSLYPKQVEVNYGPRKQSRQQSTPNQLKKDKRSIVHCQPVVVFAYPKRSKEKEKKCTSPSSDQYDKDKLLLPRLLDTEIKQYKQKKAQIIEISSSSSEENAYNLEDKSNAEPVAIEQKIWRPRQNKLGKKVQSRYRPTNTSRTSPNQLSSSRLTPHNKQSRKNIRSIELPQISRITGHSGHKPTVDCSCRQKYKTHKRQKELNGNSLEEYEERRREIVRGIRLKHKHQAQKQINYELSLIGDRTYHQMKFKSYQKRDSNKKHSRMLAGQ